jgi:hypothetical protein
LWPWFSKPRPLSGSSCSFLTFCSWLSWLGILWYIAHRPACLTVLLLINKIMSNFP